MGRRFEVVVLSVVALSAGSEWSGGVLYCRVLVCEAGFNAGVGSSVRRNL